MTEMKFRYNKTNLEFLINEAWKTNKTLAIKYKGNRWENFIELVEDKDNNSIADIYIESKDFDSKKVFVDFVMFSVR